jgi:hypothetical protein
MVDRLSEDTHGDAVVPAGGTRVGADDATFASITRATASPSR